MSLYRRLHSLLPSSRSFWTWRNHPTFLLPLPALPFPLSSFIPPVVRLVSLLTTFPPEFSISRRFGSQVNAVLESFLPPVSSPHRNIVRKGFVSRLRDIHKTALASEFFHVRSGAPPSVLAMFPVHLCYKILISNHLPMRSIMN